MRGSTCFRSSTLSCLSSAPFFTSCSLPLLPVSCRFPPSFSFRVTRLLFFLLVIPRDSCLLTNFSFFPSPPPPSAEASHKTQLAAAAAAPPLPLLETHRHSADNDAASDRAAAEETRVSEGDTAAASETSSLANDAGGDVANESDAHRIAAASQTAAQVTGDNRQEKTATSSPSSFSSSSHERATDKAGGPERGRNETGSDSFGKATAADTGGERETSSAGQTAKGAAATVPAPSPSTTAAVLREEDFEKAAEGSTAHQELRERRERETGEKREVGRERSKDTKEQRQEEKEKDKRRLPPKNLVLQITREPSEDRATQSDTRVVTQTQHLQKTEPAAAGQEKAEASSVAGETEEALGKEEGRPNEEKGEKVRGETSTREVEENEKKEGNVESEEEALLEGKTEENRGEEHGNTTSAEEDIVEGEESNGGAGETKRTEGSRGEEEREKRRSEKRRGERVMEPEEDEKREAAQGKKNQSEADGPKKEKVQTEKQRGQNIDATAQGKTLAQKKQKTEHAKAPMNQRRSVLKTAAGSTERDAQRQPRGRRRAGKRENERLTRGEDAKNEERRRKRSKAPVSSPETQLRAAPPQEIPNETAEPQEKMQEEKERKDTQNMEIQPQRVELHRFTDEEMKRIIEFGIKKELKVKEQLVEQDAEALDAEDKRLHDHLGAPDTESHVAQDDRVETPLHQQEEEKEKAAHEAASQSEAEEEQWEALQQHTLAAAEEKIPGKQPPEEEEEKEKEEISNAKEGRRAPVGEKEVEGGGEKQHSTEKEESLHHEKEKGEKAETPSDQGKKVTNEKETDESLKQQQKTRESLVQQRNQALQELNSAISSLAAVAERFESQQIQLEGNQRLNEKQSYPEQGKAQVQEQLLKENEDSLLEFLQKHERVLRWLGEDNQRSLEDIESSLIPNLRGFGDVSMNREELLQHSQESQRLINVLAGAAERFRGTLNKLNECRRIFLRDHDRALQVIYEYGRAVDLFNIEVEEKKLSNKEIEERLRACNEAFDVLSELLGTCDKRMASVVGLTGALEVMHGLSLAHLRQTIEMYDIKEAADAVTDQSTATTELTEVDEIDTSEAADTRKDEIGKKEVSDVQKEAIKVSLKPGQLQITSHVVALRTERIQLLEAASRAVDILGRLGSSVTQATRTVVKTRVEWLEELSTQLMKHFESLVQSGKRLRSREEKAGQEAKARREEEAKEEEGKQQGQEEEEAEEAEEAEAKKEEREKEEQEDDEDEDENEQKEEAERRTKKSSGVRRSTYSVRRDEDKEDFARRSGKRGETYGRPRTWEKRRKPERWRFPGREGRKRLSEDRYIDDWEEKEYEEAHPTRESSFEGKGGHKPRNSLVQRNHLQRAFRRHAEDATGQCFGRAETDLLIDVNSEGWKAIQQMAEGTQFDSEIALEVREAIEKETRNDSTTAVLGSLLGIAVLLLIGLLLYGYYLVFWYQKRINAYKIGNKAGETTERLDEGEADSTEGGTRSRDGTVRSYEVTGR